MPNQDRLSSHSRASPSRWVSRSLAGRSDNNEWLRVDDDGLRCQYIGPGTEDKDAASVRADQAVPFGCGFFYFEVEVINKGRNGFVGIGFSTAGVSLDRLPGWETHSFGYHGDDGHAFHHSGKGRPYGPTFGTGDVIGVIYNLAERTIAYSKNGMCLGVAFSDVREEGLFPTVGMRTPAEEIVANFGATPFRGDVEALRAEAAARVRQRVAACALATRPKGPRAQEQLVFDFLRHQGYWATAARASIDLLCRPDALSEADLQEVRQRRQMAEAICAGDIDGALAMLAGMAPGLLAAQPRLHFRLLCQKFMRMILAGDVGEALEYGQRTLGSMPTDTDDRELLQDALTLVAHADPADCPGFQQLLGREAHARLAATANAAVLRHLGRPDVSRLETLAHQLGAVRAELLERGDAAAALVDFDGVLRFKRKTT